MRLLLRDQKLEIGGMVRDFLGNILSRTTVMLSFFFLMEERVAPYFLDI